jgi:hypothetical protein
MLIDLLKSPIQNVLDLLNTANNATIPVPITTAQVTLGAPAVVADEALDDNTTVVVSAVALGGYTGNVEITYRRLRLNASVVTPATGFLTNDTTTLASLKTAIATALNLLEAEFDLTGTLPATFGEITVMTLTSVATSLLYVGTINVNAEWSFELSAVAPVTNMSGFDPAA